jgi:hypothetical protein
METPANIALNGDRNVLFDQTIAFFGFDFTGASARAMIRTAPDATGSALVTLAFVSSSTAEGVRLVYAGTDTIANHIAAGRIEQTDLPPPYDQLADTDELALSLIGIHILKATMAFASAPAGAAGDTISLAYDLLITPSGGIEDKYAYGPFNVRGTVTFP